MKTVQSVIHATLLAALFMAANTAAAAKPGEVVEWGSTGGINWSSGKVFAEGVGVPPERAKYEAQKRALACRAAVVDGQRNLLETTQGVRVEAKTLVKDFVVESDIIRSSVQGVVKGARLLDKTVEPDGSCRVTLGISLSGDLASTLYKRAYTAKQSFHSDQAMKLASLLISTFPDLIPYAEAKPVEIKADWHAEINKVNRRLEALEKLMKVHPERAAEGVAKGAATGLIIDARGSNFIPSLAPRVRQLRGGLLYPNSTHQREAKESGKLISLFMNDLLLAQGHPRIGERPLVLKALRTWGKTRTELVLGSGAAKKLKKLIDSGFLEHGSVIVVLN
ncbi:MAG: hypothetical protein Q9M31_05065 [Mariprofundus sp.]|nr:hypothetical protein [Mariprofundus sp.]